MAGKCAVWIVVALVGGVSVAAQQSKPTFEVASIKKRDGPYQGFARLVAERGRFSLPATNLAYLIQFAYQVRDDSIVDGPDWIRTTLFEVDARAGTEASADEMRLMMQSLLAKRFGLVIRKEQRITAHFALVPVRNDGRLGPNIQQTDTCSNRETRPKQPPLPPGAATSVGCGSMSDIATMATPYMGAPVLDRTGIAGLFHYYMHRSPAESPVIPGLPPLRPQFDPDVAQNLPSFREALRDQLGLRMESVRGPLDVLVIASVQQPTEN